jgi:hypothetical protein
MLPESTTDKENTPWQEKSSSLRVRHLELGLLALNTSPNFSTP